jgi:hypothetical protein
VFSPLLANFNQIADIMYSSPTSVATMVCRHAPQAKHEYLDSHPTPTTGAVLEYPDEELYGIAGDAAAGAATGAGAAGMTDDTYDAPDWGETMLSKPQAGTTSVPLISGSPPHTTATTATTPMPAMLEWSIVDVVLALSKDRVYAILFGTESEAYLGSLYTDKKYTGVSMGGWERNVRELKYVVPRSGLQGKTSIIEKQQLVVNAVDATLVDVVTQAPDAPFGSSFLSMAQYQMIAEGDSCRLRISGNISWTKSCSLKGTITKKVKGGMEDALRQVPEHLALFGMR